MRKYSRAGCGCAGSFSTYYMYLNDIDVSMCIHMEKCMPEWVLTKQAQSCHQHQEPWAPLGSFTAVYPTEDIFLATSMASHQEPASLLGRPLHGAALYPGPPALSLESLIAAYIPQ